MIKCLEFQKWREHLIKYVLGEVRFRRAVNKEILPFLFATYFFYEEKVLQILILLKLLLIFWELYNYFSGIVILVCPLYIYIQSIILLSIILRNTMDMFLDFFKLATLTMEEVMSIMIMDMEEETIFMFQ